MVHTISAAVAGRIWDVGVARGVAAARLRGIFGRPREALVRDARVPIASVYECFAECMRTCRDPSFPLGVATSVRFEDYSVLGFALMTSADGAEALERLQRHGHFITDSGQWRSKHRGAQLEIAWERAGRRTLGHRVANECALAELLVGLRGAISPRVAPLRVTFRHGRPAEVRAHDQFFACPIEWGARADCAVFSSGVLASVLRSSNVAMRSYFDTQLTGPGADSWARRARQALDRGLASGAPSTTEVARSLGVSARTLRRRLGEEDTSFRALLELARRDAAPELLRTHGSVSDVAFLLGFSETSAFSRAFRRWFHVSPRVALRDPGRAAHIEGSTTSQSRSRSKRV